MLKLCGGAIFFLMYTCYLVYANALCDVGIWCSGPACFQPGFEASILAYLLRKHTAFRRHTADYRVTLRIPLETKVLPKID